MQLAWPIHPLQLRQHLGRDEVYDPLRRRWLVLMPEEWVRQQLALHLQKDLQYPPQLLAVERGMRLLRLRKRFDLLVYGRSGLPALLAECKHPDVRLSEDSIRQAAQYNSHFKASWLVITNGLELWVYRQRFGLPGYERQPGLPSFLALEA